MLVAIKQSILKLHSALLLSGLKKVDNQVIAETETENEEDKAELDGKVAWLKDNEQPAHQVTQYMQDTFKQRRKWIKAETSRTVEDILVQYPRLLNPNMVRFCDIKLICYYIIPRDGLH